MRLGKRRFVPGAVVALVLMAVAGPVAVDAQVNAPLAGAPSSSIQRGFINITGSPGIPAVNPKTDTLYVPIQCITGCPALPITHTMDVISTATCNATDTSDCRVIAKAKVGGDPLAAVVDERTDTIYTANAVGTVSVVDGATCNATVVSGCGTPLATIHTGGFDVAEVLNPMTNTLYVTNPGGSVFVIGVAKCNAETILGCGAPVKEVKDAGGPAAVDVDIATDSVYAVNNGVNGNGNTVSLIDGATCNGNDGSGCKLHDHHHGGGGLLLARRGPGDRHHLCHQRRRQHDLSDRWCALQQGEHLWMCQRASDGTAWRIAGLCSGRRLSAHGLHGQSTGQHVVRDQHADMQGDQHVGLLDDATDGTGGAEPRSRLHRDSQYDKPSPALRYRLPDKRWRRKSSLGDHARPLQCRAHRGLPQPGADRPGGRLPDLGRWGDEHHIRGQPKPPRDRCHQRGHMQRRSPDRVHASR